MPDKKCPSCGLWNPGEAILCDCGYDFHAGQLRPLANLIDQRPSSVQIRNGSLYGMLAASIAALPISVLKTFAYWLGLCGPVPTYDPDRPFRLTRCGPMYYSFDHLLLFALGVLAAGALFGGIATALAMRVASSQTMWRGRRRPSLSYGPAVAAGVLFDLIFVFVLVYPGQ